MVPNCKFVSLSRTHILQKSREGNVPITRPRIHGLVMMIPTLVPVLEQHDRLQLGEKSAKGPVVVVR
jgi:hypothetical protein